MNTRVAEQAMQVFEEVMELEADARGEAIQQACSGDTALLHAIERLLACSKGVDLEGEISDPLDYSFNLFASHADDRYELLDEIGRGGMGTVYRAIDRKLDREVAIKVIHNLSLGEDTLRRFSAEVKIAAKLQHPGVAPVYDSGLLPDGQPFLAMKLVHGKTLASLLNHRRSSLDDQPRLLDAFEDLCQIVAYAHSHNIIHRDLKPDNVMVGAFGEVQVMDWGLAKWLEDRAPSDGEHGDQESSPISTPWPTGSHTRFGTVMGTPAYMPPEQIAGRRCKQTDVFSLGAILCEILTGSPPYRADSADEVFSKSAKADLDEANSRLDQCRGDAELVQLARQCLLPNPNERPADGAEVASRMAVYSQGVQSRLREAELAKARSDAKVLEEKKRRKVSALLLLTALLLVVVVFGGWGWISRREAQRWHQQAIRRSAVTEQLKQTRSELMQLYQAALDAPVNDLAAWESAQIAATQAKLTLSTSDISSQLADEIQGLSDKISAGASERELLSVIERAREESLMQISVPGKPEPSVRQRRCERLGAVFRDTPLNPASSDKRAASSYIASKSPPVKEALIGAIDEWIVRNDSRADRQWLAETATSVDDNSWRERCRDAIYSRDEEKLLAILSDAETVAQSPRSVINLSCMLNEMLPSVDTGYILRRVSNHHTDDFWLNVTLGDQESKGGNLQRASKYYQDALSVRQLSYLHRKIAVELLRDNWPQDARRHLQRALDLNDRSASSWELLGATYLRLNRLETVDCLDDAELAFNRARALCRNNLERPIDYITFLDQSGQRQKAFEYLRQSVVEHRDDSGQLHRTLINMLSSDQRYRESIEEFLLYVEKRFADPMLCVTVSHASIKATDGVGKDAEDLTSEQQRELRRQAQQCLRYALDMWLSRRTNEPVLRKILAQRDAGEYDSVFRPDSVAQLPSEQRADWNEFWSDVAHAEQRLSAFDASTFDMNEWTILDPQSTSSEAGATFRQLPDKSFLVEGERQERDVYTITSEIDLEGIHAIRLDVIADDRMPKRGPGRNKYGNFHLAEIQMWIADDSSEDGLRQVVFDRATATHSWHERPVANVIDGDANTLWHVWGQLGLSHTAKLYLDEPLKPSVGTQMVIRLIHGGDRVTAPIGRFRLSYQGAVQKTSTRN